MGLRPNPAVARGKPYSVPRAPVPVDLVLDGNEGPALAPEDLAPLAANREAVRRYPQAGALESALAARVGLEAAQCLVSAGGDDLIDRVCRTFARPGSTVVLPVPGFAMTSRYAELAEAEVVEVPWPEGAFPTDACLAVSDPAIIVITSPNNPTGAVASSEDVRRICAARPGCLVLVDAAYAEFGDEDLTEVALSFPNAVVIRTLSKAWGLAGLRVGYALGAAEVIGWLRAAGAPYPVSGPALALALDRLERGEEAMLRFVEAARVGREGLRRALVDCGVQAPASEGNFAFGRLGSEARALWLRDAMAGLGIGIRAFPGRKGLEDAVRISVPESPIDQDRTERALRTALAPQAWLLDLDGVVADVSDSYRAAIVGTAAVFGVELLEQDVREAKAAGDANNDWVLTRRMLAARGVMVSLEEVTATFEGLVQGTEEVPGLWRRERLLVPRDVLDSLRRQGPLAAVTGRPRVDAERFLEAQGIADLFDVVVCMEDGPAKPNPEPVTLALGLLGVERAWMVGDTPDDARAARAAGVVPLGVRSGGITDGALFAGGCARVYDDLRALVVDLLGSGEGVRCAG